MPGPFTTITVQQFNAMQDVIGAAILVKCFCQGACKCGAENVKLAINKWRALIHD